MAGGSGAGAQDLLSKVNGLEKDLSLQKSLLSECNHKVALMAAEKAMADEVRPAAKVAAGGAAGVAAAAAAGTGKSLAAGPKTALVAVMSTAGGFQRRSLIRSTYLQLRGPGVDVVFVMPRPKTPSAKALVAMESAAHGDVVVLEDLEDDGVNSRRAVEYIKALVVKDRKRKKLDKTAEDEYSFLVKVQDDVFVHLKNLEDKLLGFSGKSGVWYGREVEKSSKTMTGTGFAISWDLLEAIMSTIEDTPAASRLDSKLSDWLTSVVRNFASDEVGIYDEPQSEETWAHAYTKHTVMVRYLKKEDWFLACAANFLGVADGNGVVGAGAAGSGSKGEDADPRARPAYNEESSPPGAKHMKQEDFEAIPANKKDKDDGRVNVAVVPGPDEKVVAPAAAAAAVAAGVVAPALPPPPAPMPKDDKEVDVGAEKPAEMEEKVVKPPPISPAPVAPNEKPQEAVAAPVLPSPSPDKMEDDGQGMPAARLENVAYN
ncbi:hypothetical protein HK101_008598 [Irineochytrium annulatum]|nr:hypothetical protein HK101_008598 [Irineochytrium annulatum]